MVTGGCKEVDTRNLDFVGPFRIKDRKRVFKARMRFLLITLRQGYYKNFLKWLLFFKFIYVICYQSERQVHMADIYHGRLRKNQKMLERHGKRFGLGDNCGMLTLLEG